MHLTFQILKYHLISHKLRFQNFLFVLNSNLRRFCIVYYRTYFTFSFLYLEKALNFVECFSFLHLMRYFSKEFFFKFM